MRHLLLLLLACGLIANVACSPGGPAEAKTETPGEENEEKDEPAPVTVALAPVEIGEISDYIVTTSVLRAVHSADVSAEVSGLVEALEVEEGQWVKRGTVLARVDYRHLALAERKALAAHEQAKAEHERVRELEGKGLVSRESLGEARFNADQAEITWREAEVAAQKATVRAPITGVIAMRSIRLGDRVNVGQAMFSIVDTRSLEADLHLPERYLPELRVDQQCRLSTQGDDDKAVIGRVGRIAPVVDAESGTVKVVVQLDDVAPDGDEAALRPGQFVRVRLITETHADATLVPKKAVIYEEGRTLVFVRRDGNAASISFEAGLTDGDRVQALSGVTEGDEIIVTGQAALRDGSPVQTAEEALAAREAAAAEKAAEEAGESGDENADEETSADKEA